MRVGDFESGNLDPRTNQLQDLTWYCSSRNARRAELLLSQKFNQLLIALVGDRVTLIFGVSTVVFIILKKTSFLAVSGHLVKPCPFYTHFRCFETLLFVFDQIFMD